MTDYYKMTRAAGVPPVIGRVRKPPRDINAGPWIAGIVIVLLIAGISAAAYWWFTQRQATATSGVQFAPATSAIIEATTDQPDDERDSQPEALPAESEAEAAEAETGSPDQAPPETTAETAIAEPRTQSVDVVGEAADRLEPQVTIGITFSGDCWTEVSDASGRRLFYDLASAGESVSLSGVAPVRIIFGDADNVSMTVDGQDYTIPRSARRGRLARLTISSQ